MTQTKTAKDVVLAAYYYLSEVTPPTQKISEVRVEEVKPFQEGEVDFWTVILSFDNVGAFPFDKKREYKEFKVADADGTVIYMKQASSHE